MADVSPTGGGGRRSRRRMEESLVGQLPRIKVLSARFTRQNFILCIYLHIHKTPHLHFHPQSAISREDRSSNAAAAPEGGQHTKWWIFQDDDDVEGGDEQRGYTYFTVQRMDPLQIPRVFCIISSLSPLFLPRPFIVVFLLFFGFFPGSPSPVPTVDEQRRAAISLQQLPLLNILSIQHQNWRVGNKRWQRTREKEDEAKLLVHNERSL